MDHNPAQGLPNSEPDNLVDVSQSMSTLQPSDGWPNSYGMDLFHPIVPFSGSYMTSMDTEMPMFSDLTPPPSTEDESQMNTHRKSFSQVGPDEKPKQTRRRTGVLETPTDSESATPSINPGAGANSDTSTPVEASPVTRRSSNQHPKQSQEWDDELKRNQQQHQNQTSREKNRVAASKCRKKKKEEEKILLERKEMLELQRTILESTKKELEDEVLTLKSMILQHGTCNCPPIQDYIQTAASRLQALAPNIFAPPA